MTADEVVTAVRQQNVQVAAGVINGPPYARRASCNCRSMWKGACPIREQFAQIVIKRDGNGVITRLGDVARVEIDASQYGLRSLLDNKAGGRAPDLPGAGLQCHADFRSGSRHHGGAEEEFPARPGLSHRL